MYAPLDCPELESWRALVAAALPPEEQERCERHLESCPVCRDHLDRTEGGGDDLLRLARRVGDPTAAPADPTLVQVLERLHETAGPERAAPPEPPDLCFLRPADRPGLLGTLGGYDVQGVIGQGGMGVVLKAYDPALHRVVAIKVLSPAVAGSATARRRFTREAQAAAAVCHDHVVAVHGVHEADGLPYLVMQYVAGESLQERLARAGPLELTEVVRIGMQTAQGLAAAHAQGLIHRDVKPANILLEDGLARVKITDFGLARTADDVGLTQAGTVAGTPEYMAPEQARGEQVDPRCDLFSLGSVLYAMTTGRPPFRGSTALAVLRRVGDEAPAPVRSLNPHVPAWLESLIARLMAKEPTERFQSAAEVAALLEGYLAHLRQPAVVPAPELPPSPAGGEPASLAPARAGGRRWRRGPFWLLAVLVALTTLGLFRWLLGAGGPPPQNSAGGEVTIDFRGGNVPPPPLTAWTGRDGDEVIEPEEKGLHITLPVNRRRTEPVGLVVNGPVAGNFTITTGFELVRADRPRTGAGVGYELYITTNSPGREAIALARTKQSDDQDVFACSRMTTDPQGKRQYTTHVFPASAAAGRLRLTRSGPEVTCWAADGAAAELQELCRFDLGVEDLKYVRLCAHPGQSAEPVDIRILDVRIGADVSPPGSTSAATATPAGGMRKGVALPVCLGLAFTVALIALAAWVFRARRGQGAARAPAPLPGKETAAPPEAAAPAVSFACPACGSHVKARAGQAGKKGKCPHCGKAVSVPGIKAGKPGSPPA
jgi:serine/threonine protein kinase